MKIIGQIEKIEVEYISNNFIWSTVRTTTYRTIFGFKMWVLNSYQTCHKYGDPYKAHI